MPVDQIPKTWRDVLGRLEGLIEQRSLTAATCYPAILEGDRRDPSEELATNPLREFIMIFGTILPPTISYASPISFT
jgi:hypothetical protein